MGRFPNISDAEHASLLEKNRGLGLRGFPDGLQKPKIGKYYLVFLASLYAHERRQPSFEDSLRAVEHYFYDIFLFF